MMELTSQSLSELLVEVRSCTACSEFLPAGPRPVLQATETARLLIVGQAPGSRVHASGVPFDDPSGRRLREWMGVTDAEFHDETRVAILPMGFCYPGRKAGGDSPPRPECARLWRSRILNLLPDIRLTLLVGTYAQDHVLGPGRMGERVAAFRSFLPRYFPLPHPAWRSQIWMARNPWFEAEALPELRTRVRAVLEAPL